MLTIVAFAMLVALLCGSITLLVLEGREHKLVLDKQRRQFEVSCAIIERIHRDELEHYKRQLRVERAWYPQLHRDRKELVN